MDYMHARIIAEKLITDTFTNGGASLTPTGENVDFGLWTGYIVSEPNRQAIAVVDAIPQIGNMIQATTKWILKYPLSNGCFYGSWYDRDSGLIYLDHSKFYQSLSVAWNHAITNGQKAIYDVALDQSFPVASGVGHTGISDGVQSHSSGPIFPYRLVDEAFDQNNGCIIAYNPQNKVVFRSHYTTKTGTATYSHSSYRTNFKEAYRIAERFCWLEKNYPA